MYIFRKTTLETDSQTNQSYQKVRFFLEILIEEVPKRKFFYAHQKL